MIYQDDYYDRESGEFGDREEDDEDDYEDDDEEDDEDDDEDDDDEDEGSHYRSKRSARSAQGAQSAAGPYGDEPVELAIDGTLDLHAFHPRDVGDLVPGYLEACRRKGIYQVRIVHGKGTGGLRRTVQAILEKHPDVATFRLGGEGGGGWGATIVNLRRPGRVS
jgi:DNA-nicking Smr family endonuclease